MFSKDHQELSRIIGAVMSRLKEFCKHEATLCIAAIAAIVSCCFVPPNPSYASYFDLRTLALLYCLMVVVSGFCEAGLFNWLAHCLCSRAHTARTLGAVLIALSFFSSMLITNDVALLTFVPFALVVLGLAHCERELIIVIVLQTVAANLGSMLTPVGNPQNLYLHSFYNMSNSYFFSSTLPVWLASGAALFALGFLVHRQRVTPDLGEAPPLQKRELPFYSFLFVVCLLVVFRFMAWYYMLGIVALALALHDKRMLKKADFLLLLTFVCFFIFAGNLAHIDAINLALCNLLKDNVYAVSMALSQIISNVPAALLLSSFTADAHELLLGVDIGGLGTPVASLASLISLKLYTSSPQARTGRYLMVFSLINFALLALFSGIFG